MLWNKTETNPTVYIGKASYNCVINRLRSHNREKDFWKNAVVLSSDIFADADIEWVEATLISKARKYERCNLYNKKEEDYNDKLNESNRQETARKVSWFVKNVLRNKLGIDIFLSLENSWHTTKPFALLSYYEMLEIGMTCSTDEIKKAYKIKSLQFHPDRNAGSTESQDKMRLINEAYEVLTDQVKRKNYDSKIISEEIAADKAAEAQRKAEQAKRQQEQARKQQEEARRQQQEQARQQYSYQQQNRNYNQGDTNKQYNPNVPPKINHYKKYDTFLYGAAVAAIILLIIFSPALLGKKTEAVSVAMFDGISSKEWREIVTKLKNTQKEKSDLQEKLDLLNNSSAQKTKEIAMLKDAVEKSKKEAEAIKQEAQKELENAKKIVVENENKKEEIKRQEIIVKEKNDALLAEAEKIKQNYQIMEKQSEEKLAGVKMQEKINLEFRNESFSRLKIDCDKLQKNISAYDNATGGFIDVFQNRLPSSAIDVQKSSEVAREALKIFPHDAELTMQLNVAKMLLDKTKKRVVTDIK